MTDSQLRLLMALANGQHLRNIYASGMWKYIGGPQVEGRDAFALRDAGYIRLVEGSASSGMYGITAEGRKALHAEAPINRVDANTREDAGDIQ